MSAVITDTTSPTSGGPSARSARRSVAFLRWLRRIHLYVGLWGAALGLLFGITGVLMNHRAVLKIPLEKAVQGTAQLPLPDGQPPFENAEAMGRWLQAELHFANAQSERIRTEPPRRVVWADRELQQPARWTFNWQAPDRGVNAEYVVGNRFVKVDSQDATPVGTLMRLHTASGTGVFWVLLSDTIGGALTVLAITGLLLWSRLHRIRLAAVSTSLVALLAAGWFLWTAGLS
ncbi:MAG TPA: PepSY-associated TM helix domain-containing protein [Burkholderiales bacterium]|nr:PepSY-associated TM helix domain-containing protein [Burkholderiales bacterium]